MGLISVGATLAAVGPIAPPLNVLVVKVIAGSVGLPLGYEPGSEGRDLKRYGTVALIGVGLIGGSIGLALRARRLAAHVVGVGRDQASLEIAARKGAIDRGTTDLQSGVAEADLVIVCTPVNRIAEDVLRAAVAAPAEVLIVDVGSSKRQIVEAVERDSRSAAVFVGAHPLAGSEKQARYSTSNLFQKASLHPHADASNPARAYARSSRSLDRAWLPRRVEVTQ